MHFQRYNKAKHFEILKNWYSNQDILDQMELAPMSEVELTNWLDQTDRIHLIFFHNDIPVGCVNFYHYKTHFPDYELGYLVDPDHQGQGIATKIVQQAIIYAKIALGIARISEVYVIDNNIASKKVLEKNGFTQDRYDEAKGRTYFYKVL